MKLQLQSISNRLKTHVHVVQTLGTSDYAVVIPAHGTRDLDRVLKVLDAGSTLTVPAALLGQNDELPLPDFMAVLKAKLTLSEFKSLYNLLNENAGDGGPMFDLVCKHVGALDPAYLDTETLPFDEDALTIGKPDDAVCYEPGPDRDANGPDDTFGDPEEPEDPSRD